MKVRLKMGENKVLVDLLTNLLQNKDGNEMTMNELGYLASVSSAQVALALQDIIGTDGKAAELLVRWEKNKRFLPDQASKMRAELPGDHVLQKVIAEHEMILCLLSDLEAVGKEIAAESCLSSTTHEVRRLASIAEHLVSSEQHREREEEVIYPALRRSGYSGLLELTAKQHLDLSRANYKLKSLVWQVDSMHADFFKYQLAEYIAFIVPNMREHIFIETVIVYPLAIELIRNRSAWKKMKEICDQIWY